MEAALRFVPSVSKRGPIKNKRSGNAERGNKRCWMTVDPEPFQEHQVLVGSKIYSLVVALNSRTPVR